MNEQDLRLLLTLEQTRNITQASEQLFITQSALSRRLSVIEQELDATLMVRGRHGIRFTPDGEIVVRYAKSILEQYDCMRKELDEKENNVSGTLRAGISKSFSLYRLPYLLAKYHKAYPNIKTHITTGRSHEIYRMMMDGEFDLVIVRGEYTWNEEQILIGTEPVCAIIPESKKNCDLSEIPYIARKLNPEFVRKIEQWRKENGLTIKKDELTVNDITACVNMVSLDIGWTIVPEIYTGNFRGEIQPLFYKNGQPIIVPTYLLTTTQASEFTQIQAFIDLAKESAE